MATYSTAFRLMVSWDRAVIALERAIARGHQQFEVLHRANGLLTLRQRDGTVLDVEIRIDTPTSTFINIRPRRRRLGLRGRNDRRIHSIIETFWKDVVQELRFDSTA